MDDLSATASSRVLFSSTPGKDKKRKKLFKLKKPKWSQKGRSSGIAEAIIANPVKLGETTGEHYLEHRLASTCHLMYSPTIIWYFFQGSSARVAYVL